MSLNNNMHELSLAINIIDICLEELQKASGSRADKITLEIGELACIDQEALSTSIKETVKHTALENTEFEFKKIRGLARCLSCNQTFTIAEIYEACPYCEDFRTDVIQGKEIKIKSLQIQ